jgi:hypothetical protein
MSVPVVMFRNGGLLDVKCQKHCGFAKQGHRRAFLDEERRRRTRRLTLQVTGAPR